MQVLLDLPKIPLLHKVHTMCLSEHKDIHDLFLQTSVLKPLRNVGLIFTPLVASGITNMDKFLDF